MACHVMTLVVRQGVVLNSVKHHRGWIEAVRGRATSQVAESYTGLEKDADEESYAGLEKDEESHIIDKVDGKD